MNSRPSPRELLTTRLREVVESLLEPEDASYTALTVTAICQAAGISRPTFYSYFDDKVELIRAVAADTIVELVGASALWLDAPKSTRAELNQAMTALFAGYAPHRKVMAAAAEVASYDETLRDAFASSMEAAARQVRDHIADGQRQGLVRPGLRPLPTARWLAWMTELGLRRAFARRDTAEPEAVAAMTDIHWFTLYEAV
jgi:TetR/AcrR family transcriptional regulator, ethionamide resistance regulator